MTEIELHLAADDQEVLDATRDLEMLLELEGEGLYDLSPAFRRVLFELEDAFADVLLRAANARGRAQRLRRESDAVRAQSRQARSRGRHALSHLLGPSW